MPPLTGGRARRVRGGRRVTAIERLLRSERRVRSLLLLAHQAGVWPPALVGQDMPVYVGSRKSWPRRQGSTSTVDALAIAERRLSRSEDVVRRRVSGRAGRADRPGEPGGHREERPRSASMRCSSTRRAPIPSTGERCGCRWARSSSCPGPHRQRWPDGLARVREVGITLVALTPAPDAMPIDEFVTSAPPRLALLSDRGPGLSAAALAACDMQVRIPLRAGVDSLNVAHAAGNRLPPARRPRAGTGRGSVARFGCRDHPHRDRGLRRTRS